MGRVLRAHQNTTQHANTPQKLFCGNNPHAKLTHTHWLPSAMLVRRFHSHGVPERNTEADVKPMPHRPHARPHCCRRLSLAALAALVTVVAIVMLAPRPLLRLQQLVLPLQLLTIEAISPHRPRGYEVTAIPSHVFNRLRSVLEGGQLTHKFGGTGEPIEDYIIFGRTSRFWLPEALRHEVQEAFRPLLSSFCACELSDQAVVHGIRVYHQGATLATHLDWADQWVVSATLHLRTIAVANSSELPTWPLVVRGLDGSAHTVVHAEGEAVMYEGSRLLHGRPSPFGGAEYAALFVGFVPDRYPERSGPSTRLTVNTVKGVKRIVLQAARVLFRR